MNRLASMSACMILVAAAAAPASAQAPMSRSTDANKVDMKSMDMGDKAQPSRMSHSASGVVKGMDPAAGSITLAHDPIKSLNSPAMTMGFKVQDKRLLDKIKPGDKVQFTLVQSGKAYIVTSIK